MQCPHCHLENPENAQRCDCGFDFLSKSIEKPYITEKQNPRYPITVSKYSTFLPRFFAGIIDGVVFWPIGWLEQKLYQTAPDHISTTLQYVLAYDSLIYSIALHSIWGRTIGKMVTGVKVTSYPHEGRITFKQAFLRDSVPFVVLTAMVVWSPFVHGQMNLLALPHFALLVLVLTGPMWALIELITMFSNEKRRALHDYIAGTVVIRT